MTFWDDVKNGMYKLRERIFLWWQRVIARKRMESQIRRNAKIAAEPEYWKERAKYINEQEVIRAKRRARPNTNSGFTTPKPLFSVGKFGDSPLNSNVGNGMANYDFLGTKHKKGKGKEKTMEDIKFR